MSNKSERLIVEQQLQTLSDSHGFPNRSVLIKTVEMFSNISMNKPFSETLNKELISANVREIKAFMQKYGMSDIREMVIGARKSESHVKKYLTLLPEKNEDEMLVEEDNVLSKMFANDDTIIEDETILSDFEEEDENEQGKEKTKSKSKPKPKKDRTESGGNAKKIFYGVVIVFIIGIVVFLFLMVTSMLDEIEHKEAQKLQNKQAKSVNQTSQAQETQDNMPSVQNNVSAKFGAGDDTLPPPTSSTQMTKMTPPPLPEDSKIEIEAVVQQASLVAVNQQEVVDNTVYPPIPVSAVKRSPGGVCQLIPKYFSKEDDFIYYIKKENAYIPAFQERNWDGNGLKIEDRTVGLSIDEENGLVEVENGKFLPIELFSSCSLFEQ